MHPRQNRQSVLSRPRVPSSLFPANLVYFEPREQRADELGAAAFYAATMIAAACFAKNGDTLLMGIMQIGWIGAFGVICGFAFETPVLPSSPLEWSYLAFLVVVCTGFGFTLQPVVQRHLPTERASMMCALNPLVACVLGVLVEPLLRFLARRALGILEKQNAHGLLLSHIALSGLGACICYFLRSNISSAETMCRSSRSDALACVAWLACRFVNNT